MAFAELVGDVRFNPPPALRPGGTMSLFVVFAAEIVSIRPRR